MIKQIFLEKENKNIQNISDQTRDVDDDGETANIFYLGYKYTSAFFKEAVGPKARIQQALSTHFCKGENYKDRLENI